jgi:hypothetical protein
MELIGLVGLEDAMGTSEKKCRHVGAGPRGRDSGLRRWVHIWQDLGGGLDSVWRREWVMGKKAIDLYRFQAVK